MNSRLVPFWVWIPAALAATTCAGAVPPGRQYVLTIEGENRVTFLPQSGLNPAKIDYKAQIEYIVNTRVAKTAAETKTSGADGTVTAVRTRKKRDFSAAVKVASAVDILLHSTEMRFRRDEQVIAESRISRARFQGRINPDSPVFKVAIKEAPPALERVLKAFDTTAATMLVDDDFNVVNRKFRTDLPFHAIVDTLLSIHTPIPLAVAFWEAPTWLAMGHGQTAKGKLRFEKEKENVARTGGLVKVKVSGRLKAEGVIAGQLIKDGTYTVTGEQIYEPNSREWRSAHWSVVVDNELVNPAGLTVARAKGTMLVVSRLLGASPATSEEPSFVKQQQ